MPLANLRSVGVTVTADLHRMRSRICLTCGSRICPVALLHDFRVPESYMPPDRTSCLPVSCRCFSPRAPIPMPKATAKPPASSPPKRGDSEVARVLGVPKEERNRLGGAPAPIGGPPGRHPGGPRLNKTHSGNSSVMGLKSDEHQQKIRHRQVNDRSRQQSARGDVGLSKR